MSEVFDPYAPNSEDRYEAMASARAGDGVVPTSVGYYLATAAAVESGLRDVERFVGSFIDTAGLPEEDTPISAIPEPRHGPIRRVINTVSRSVEQQGRKTRTDFDSSYSSPPGHRGNATAIRTNTAPPSSESSNLRAGRTPTGPQRRPRPRVCFRRIACERRNMGRCAS